MPDDITSLLSKIQGIMPDLAVEHIERNQEGLINDVVMVNHQLVFRFARNEMFARLLQVEAQILDLVRPHLGVRVPEPIVLGQDFMVYPLLEGEPLERRTVMASGSGRQAQVAHQLGEILYQLHHFDVSSVADLPVTRAPVRRDDWLDIQHRMKMSIYPLFQHYQIQWADELFAAVLDDPVSAVFTPALIHGDLASYHILLDEGERKITALLDFGMAGLGDPASDIGNLISIYGESFVVKMMPGYPDLDKHLPRARFYAQLLEIEWVLNGLESGEAFWFTAHLGAARDILG